MNKEPLELLSDLVTEAHTKIQADFSDINPVVSVSRKMRSVGIPADVMMVDCLKSGKRILIILNDTQPNAFSHQFCMKDEDPSDDFTLQSIDTLSSKLLYEWMRDYFSAS